MTTISVVVPTVKGREAYLDRCLDAYESQAGPYSLQMIVLRDRPTCGAAWQEGSEMAIGDFIHFTADDLEVHAGALQVAVTSVTRGELPAAIVYRPDGTMETCAGTTRRFNDGTLIYPPMYSAVPFMTRTQWERIGGMGPMADAHYFTDNWISWRASQAGIGIFVRTGYAFTHHTAQEGRGAGMTESQRMFHDQRKYLRAVGAM